MGPEPNSSKWPGGGRAYIYMKHELFEELEAFDPKWQSHYANIAQAACAAGVMNIYRYWIKTREGEAYLRLSAGVPDYKGAIEKEQESASRLPFGLSNLGSEK